MLTKLLIGFVVLCLLVYVGMMVIAYLAMNGNRKEIEEVQRLHTILASRPMPEMLQMAAKEAGAHNVFPINDGNKIYMVERTLTREFIKYNVGATRTTGELVWRTELYSHTFAPSIEADKQYERVVDFFLKENFQDFFRQEL